MAVITKMPEHDRRSTDHPSAGSPRQFAPEVQDHFYALTQDLQSTLELEQVLNIFFLHLNKLLPCDSLLYQNKDKDIEYLLGKASRHSCRYSMSVNDETYGQLTFTRSKRFSAKETSLLENYLVSLIYPLRNALLYREAQENAIRDTLTGVLNRAAMDTELDQEIKSSHRHAIPLSLIVIDVDHFKKINDQHGHSTGDCVLKTLAELIQICVRESDIVYRYGGEEFTVLLKHTGVDGAALLAERLRKIVGNTPIQCEGHSVGITISLGVTSLKPSDNPSSLFDRADEAMYAAKEAGRNRSKIIR